MKTFSFSFFFIQNFNLWFVWRISFNFFSLQNLIIFWSLIIYLFAPKENLIQNTMSHQNCQNWYRLNVDWIVVLRLFYRLTNIFPPNGFKLCSYLKNSKSKILNLWVRMEHHQHQKLLVMALHQWVNIFNASLLVASNTTVSIRICVHQINIQFVFV